MVNVYSYDKGELDDLFRLLKGNHVPSETSVNISRSSTEDEDDHSYHTICPIIENNYIDIQMILKN